MSTAIVEVQTAVAEFDKVAAGLAELQKQYGGVVYDVTTTKGMDEAKAARAAVREPRYEIERVRKAAKAPILKLGKELDDRAKAITADILKIEEPIDEQIKNEEARKEAEKQAKIAAEQKRVADLQERVAELRGNRMLSPTSGSELIAEHISDLEGAAVDDTFQEFREQAEAAKAEGLEWLRNVHAAAVGHEAEQARIKAEREELARLRAEQAERDRLAEIERKALAEKQAAEAAAERARIAEEERQAKALRDAEAAKQAEELRLMRLAQETAAAAERKRIADEEAAAKAIRDAEAKKLADERAEFERQQAEARRIKEEQERVQREQARLASIKKPSDDELLGVLAKHYNVPATKVVEWLLAVDFSTMENAA
jgi:colicin import membrane protein